MLGVRLVMCDYNGDNGSGQSLTELTPHLQEAFISPNPNKIVAITGEEIVASIDFVHQLGLRRLRKEETDHYPVLLVIDEFSSFIKNTPPPTTKTRVIEGDKSNQTITETQAPTYLTKLADMLITLRKVNVGIVVMGQDWTQISTNGLRVFRSNFSNIFLHKLSVTDAKLFTDDKETKARVESLDRGQVLVNGRLIQVPLLTSTTKQKAIARIAGFHYDSMTPLTLNNQPYIWTEEDHRIYQEAYDRYWDKIHQSHIDAIPMETREDLILFLLQKGKSKTWVKEQLRGTNTQIYKTISEIEQTYGLKGTD